MMMVSTGRGESSMGSLHVQQDRSSYDSMMMVSTGSEDSGIGSLSGYSGYMIYGGPRWHDESVSPSSEESGISGLGSLLVL
jgi:hypothetical protein